MSLQLEIWGKERAGALLASPFSPPFHEKLESIQYNGALAITGAIRGSSREKLYQELGFESLKQRRWYKKTLSLLQNNKKPISQVPL